MNLVEKIDPTIFREYDLRGIYGKELTLEVAYTLGKSFGTYIAQKGEKQVVIGYDARTSSPILHQGLVEGIIKTGINVVDLGLVTTPMYYYAKKKLDLAAGIMITASHNPKEYNGFKISFEKIGNAYGKAITDFRDFTNRQSFIEGNGMITPFAIEEDYLSLIQSSITLGEKRIKAVVDCGSGTGSIIIKKIMAMFPIDCIYLYCENEPDFPHHHPDPAVPENLIDLKNKVLEHQCDIGIGIDGDADRVGIVDEKGNILGADLYLLIMYRYLNQSLKNRKALFDVKCSKTLIDALNDLKIEPVMYRTGNSYMNMMMQKGDFDFGGEFSGHVFFRDKFPGFDDGIYAGLRMIEVLSKGGRALSDWLLNTNHYESTPELKVAVSDENKFEIVEKVKQYCVEQKYSIVDLDGVRATFEDGWALVRASNTGPNLTIRFEATTKERLEELEAEFRQVINQSR